MRLLRLQFLIAAEDARLTVLEMKYNPNWAAQPRVPRGQPNGGQWTNGGATAGVLPGGGVNSRPASTRPEALLQLVSSEVDDFRIQLEENDRDYGGNFNPAHTLRTHVEVPTARRTERVEQSVVRVTVPGPLGSRVEITRSTPVGSFDSRDSAERAINDAFQRPEVKERLRVWIRGSKLKTQVTVSLAYSPSDVAYFDVDNYVVRFKRSKTIRILLRRDLRDFDRFYVETAYPFLPEDER